MARKQTILGKPVIQIIELKLKACEHFGPALRKARQAMGYTSSAVAREIKWHPSSLNNYEKANPLFGNGIKTAFKYAKAIGIKQITFIL